MYKERSTLLIVGAAMVIFLDSGLFYWIGWGLLILGLFAIFGGSSRERKNYFCADCGQYLGHSPARCDRCGCNRYTDVDSGVGRSYRNR